MRRRGDDRMFTTILRPETIVIRQADATLQASDNRYYGIGKAGQVAKHFAHCEHLGLTIGSLLSKDDARGHHPRDPANRCVHPEVIVSLYLGTLSPNPWDLPHGRQNGCL